MSASTTQKRKLTYLGGILALLIPIISLGMPSSRENRQQGVEANAGGKLASLRAEYDLGESDLGDLDPSSSAMNLVLLGLRGVAVNVLWQQLDESKDHKDWSTMRAVSESIIKLQPHFIKVWDFVGWNMAWNVSAEWDDVRDRFYWVKEGGKFLRNGVSRNVNSPDLNWYVGNVYGRKIGLSDETKYFRRLFNPKGYPATQVFDMFKSDIEPDVDFNPDGIDNYQVAKLWFEKANLAERKQRQVIMDRSIFRSSPSRSQIDYSDRLHDDGVFGETARLAWAQAHQDWTQSYGKDLMLIRIPPSEEHPKGLPLELWMEMDDGDIADKSAEYGVPTEVINRWVEQYRKIVNYRHWRNRTLCEQETGTADAHKEIFEAGEHYRKDELTEAIAKVDSGLKKLHESLARFDDQAIDGDLVDEALLACMLRSSAYQLQGLPEPQDNPLKPLFDKMQGTNDMDRVVRDFDKNYLRR